MKMQLMTLIIDNFKCYEHKEFCFDGRSAAICGRNGTGKTTVYDAFTWLLFGKDSKGDKDFQIKPTFREGERAGEIKDHSAVTAVEAALLVDGTARTLRRTYYEVWSVKRGSREAAFDGHSSDFYVDGVPVKKNEYERRVGEMVPEDKFKLLTSLFYFSKQLPWRDRRAVLFDVAGVATDSEIMDSDARFKPLSDAMEGRGLDDCRKMLAARRKGLNKTRSDTPARLDECRKTVEALSAIDFAALEREWECKVNARRALRAELEVNRRDSQTEKLDGEITETLGKLQKLEAANAAWRTGQQKPDGRAEEVRVQQAAAARLNAAMKRRQRDLAYMRDRAGDLDAEIAQCRKQRDRIEAEEFHGQLCPTCGRRLPEDKLEAALAGFERDKADRKARAEAAARRAEGRRKEAMEDVERMEQEEAEDGQALREMEAQLKELVAAPVPEIADLPNYAADKASLEHQLEDLRVRRESRVNAAVLRHRALRADLDRAQEELDELAMELAKRTSLDMANRRMEELRAQARAAAGELAEVDRLLALCDAFTRYKVKFVEDSINRRFSLVKFRLFREQINGGIEDCCDVLVGGAAVGNSLNTGAEFRAGVDIINTLSRCYGLWVPLFIDGAESVTGPLEAGTQTIQLRVESVNQGGALRVEGLDESGE